MRPLDMFLAVLVAAIWGGNFVAAKFGVSYFPPFFLMGLRFTVTAALLLPFVARPGMAQLRQIALVAFLLGVMHFALLFSALRQGLDIASSTIVGELGVPFACLLSVFFLGDRLGKWRIIGMAIAFAGIVIISGTPNILDHKTAFATALISTLCWGIANIVIKRIQGVGSFQMLAWMALMAVPMLFTLSALFEDNAWGLIAATPPGVAIALGYTVFGSTFVAYGLWYWLLNRYSVSQVTPFSLLVPPFGIACGQLFFAQPLTAPLLIGGAITIVGVGIIILRRPQLMEIGEQV